MSDASHSTILVGVDGSDRSADALALARTLSDRLQAKPLAVYVHPYGDLRHVLSDTQYEEAIGELADSVHDHMRTLGIPVDQRAMTLVGERSPARGLQVVPERRAAPLLVVGSSHRSRVGRIVPGGTAERLLSGAPCPVAIAPRGYADRETGLGTVGVAFDGSDESRLALTWAKQLTGRGDIRVRLLAVREPMIGATVAPPDALPIESVSAYLRRELEHDLAEAERQLHTDGVAAEGVLLRGDAATVLQEQTADLDLLVMGSRGYGPAGAVLLGSVATALVRTADAPVVVVPRTAEAAAVRASA